jgi:hypothetical protein
MLSANAIVASMLRSSEFSGNFRLLTLAAACGALLEAPDVPVRTIRVLERDGSAGRVYEKPSNCPALLQAPLATLRLAAAANSRPFVGGLDASDP